MNEVRRKPAHREGPSALATAWRGSLAACLLAATPHFGAATTIKHTRFEVFVFARGANTLSASQRTLVLDMLREARAICLTGERDDMFAIAEEWVPPEAPRTRPRSTSRTASLRRLLEAAGVAPNRITENTAPASTDPSGEQADAALAQVGNVQFELFCTPMR